MITPRKQNVGPLQSEEVPYYTCAFCDTPFLPEQPVIIYCEKGAMLMPFCEICAKHMTLPPGTAWAAGLHDGES